MPKINGSKVPKKPMPAKAPVAPKDHRKLQEVATDRGTFRFKENKVK